MGPRRSSPAIHELLGGRVVREVAHDGQAPAAVAVEGRGGGGGGGGEEDGLQQGGGR